MTIPTLKGKFIFINPGIKTLPIAIAKPINIVPTNKKLVPNKDLIIIPLSKSNKEIKIVRSIPIRLAIFGANGERQAKANKGKVVIVPASVLLIPRSSRINEINQPTEVSGARKFAPTKMIPMNNIQFINLSSCVFSKVVLFLFKLVPLSRLVFNYRRIIGIRNMVSYLGVKTT